jgi:hypothetical protein
MRRLISSCAAVLTFLAAHTSPLRAADLPKVSGVEAQPLAAQVRRVVEALDLLGQPLVASTRA